MEETIPEALINSMCLTWRHDFGVDAPKGGGLAFATAISSGMTEQAREYLRMQMRQIYQHHVLPAVMAERERCAKVAEAEFEAMKALDMDLYKLHATTSAEICGAKARTAQVIATSIRSGV